MRRTLTEAQVALLHRAAAGELNEAASEGNRISSRALSRRQLLIIKGRGSRWSAMLTDVGRYYLEHGDYPPGHSMSKTAMASPAPPTPQPVAPEPKTYEDDWEVDSPHGKRRRGHRPKGDDMLGGPKDPYDEKILVTVKEAAWMLSLAEDTIRRAVRNDDLDRVFIGDGETNYRIVYGSLLAWVNDMPRESARHWWSH